MIPVAENLCYDIWKAVQVSHLDKVSLMAQQEMHDHLQGIDIIFWERVIQHMEANYNETSL